MYICYKVVHWNKIGKCIKIYWWVAPCFSPSSKVLKGLCVPFCGQTILKFLTFFFYFFFLFHFLDQSCRVRCKSLVFEVFLFLALIQKSGFCQLFCPFSLHIKSIILFVIFFISLSIQNHKIFCQTL